MALPAAAAILIPSLYKPPLRGPNREMIFPSMGQIKLLVLAVTVAVAAFSVFSTGGVIASVV